jgi:enoyl-CoA hydratase/carnithine racemase
LPDFERIVYEQDNGVVRITLNRPEKLNAFDDQMAGELAEAWHLFDSDQDAFVAVLSGSGRAFCSGADVQQRQLRSRGELIRLGGPAGRNAPRTPLQNTVNWKPVIGAIHGYAIGQAGGSCSSAT